VKILPDRLSESKAFQSHFPEARILIRENRVYNLKEEPDRLRVFVLGDEPMPHEVRLYSRDGQVYWSCECGAAEPCLHLAALIVRSEDLALPEDHWRRTVFPETDQAPSADPDPFTGGLFDPEPSVTEDGAAADPPSENAGPADYELSLFPGDLFDEAHREHQDIPLFQGLPEEDMVLRQETPRYDLIFTLTGTPGEGVMVRPALLRLREGRRSGGITRYKASRPVTPLRPEQQTLLDRLTAEEEETLPLDDCMAEVLGQPELHTTDKKVLTVLEARSLEVAFRFQELLGDDRPLYCPEFRFRDDEGEVQFSLSDRSQLFVRGGRVFCLDSGRAVLAVLPEDTNTSFFLNLLLSKSQGFLAADIRGIIRLGGNLNNHCMELNENFPPVSIRRAEPSPLLKLRSRQDKTEVFFFFRYGSADVAYQDRVYWLPPGEPEGGGVLVVHKRNRDAEGEQVKQIIDQITDHLAFEKGYYARLVNENEDGDLRLDLPLKDFLTFYADTLNGRGVELYLEDRKISTGGAVRYSVRSETDWLEVDALVEEPDVEELRSLFFDDHYQTLGLISTGRSYVRLSEGELRQLEYLRRQGMNDDGQLEASQVNFSLIDHIYEQVVDREDSPVEDVIEQGRTLREAADQAPLTQPENLNATLRPYQLTGYNWLLRLHGMSCHGCLADDMGLGKTLQTLSLLQNLKEAGTLTTSLLVAPVVTLANWERELERFTPDLTCTRHAGSGRSDSADAFRQFDLVIVSYHTLRNDVDLFLDLEFDYIILDEAHYIKNASSVIFKAIRSLRSRHRLSLTGTPIENNTMELWSQFNFLNPGLFGSQKDFQNRFAQPIEKKNDTEALQILRDTVSPFILRRKKEDVLDDLPPKEIIVHYSEMTDSQAELYRKYRDYYRARVKGLLDEKGMAGSSIEIFQFILKLRQIAIYPPMAGPEGVHAGSCKMDALTTWLDEILEEDHKILIFSQFLGTLEAMGEHCRHQHWDYSMITGQTPDRAEEIRRFQEEEDVRIFLLSLKAGGVGINLTAADYVVLFDPWWNPAAERQAIDRAHRMGQTRKVISYKMIVRDTIEEKILRLQEQKTALMEGIIQDDRSFFGSLGEEDLVGLFE